MNQKNYAKGLIGITAAVLVFHFLILLKIVPYDIAWGGRIETVQEMIVLELLSIAINLFFVLVLLQKVHLVRLFFSERALTYILWGFFFIFVLNTLGNLFAKTLFEKIFAIVTFIYAFLIWKLNKRQKSNQ